MIKWDNVTKIFNSDLLAKPVVALDAVSFELQEGTMTGYLGANGAGKTTSLKIALGFTSLTKGEVHFSPTLGRDRQEAFKNIGFLPERPYFYPHLTGQEFSSYMGLLSGMKEPDIAASRTKLAERLHIAHALQRPLRTYSKGMLQRLGFLVAIQHDPRLIILDEPLSGLDPVGRKELKDLIADIHKDGKTVFFSTHIVGDVEDTCENMVFLSNGKVAYSGRVQTLMEKSSNRACRVILEAVSAPTFDTPVISVEARGPTWLVKVDVSHREKLLAEVIQTGAKIIAVDNDTVRLEQIVYGQSL